MLFVSCQKFLLNYFKHFSADDSPGTPERQPARALSKIADRNQKLKAYRLQKNTLKLKEIQDKRSPFVVTVPVGRWLEKKEPAPKFRIGINDTPVRHVLMTERVLKRSTVKKLAQSTLKKQNVMVFGKEASKPVAVKSKKRILGELNAVQTAVQRPEKLEETLERVNSDLNTTFEVTPEQDENKESKPRKLLRRSNSVPEIAPRAKFIAQKMLTPPAQGAIKKMKPKGKAVILKPVIRPATAPVNATAPVKSIAPSKRLMKQTATVKSDPKQPELNVVTQEPESELIEAPTVVAKATERPAFKKQPARSSTYNLYKSSLAIQTSYLTMNISGIMQNKDMFFEMLSDEQQTFFNQTVQQGNLIISDKLGKFQEFLDQFEAGLSQPDNPKRITSDDVENYWYLIFEEIETLKSNLSKTQEIKKGALTTIGSERKRRTRRTYIPEDGTPRRSRRIADIGDTPK